MEREKTKHRTPVSTRPSEKSARHDTWSVLLMEEVVVVVVGEGVRWGGGVLGGGDAMGGGGRQAQPRQRKGLVE